MSDYDQGVLDGHRIGFRDGVSAAHDALLRCRDAADSGNDYEVLDGAMADVRALLDRALAAPAAPKAPERGAKVTITESNLCVTPERGACPVMVCTCDGTGGECLVHYDEGEHPNALLLARAKLAGEPNREAGGWPVKQVSREELAERFPEKEAYEAPTIQKRRFTKGEGR